jgi:hypothetical protein
MYLQASRFGKLLRMSPKRLGDTNLKAVLAQEFGAPTLHSEGLAFLREAEPADAALMGVDPLATALQVHITGRSLGRVPITFQLMAVPQTPYALKLDFNPPGTA